MPITRKGGIISRRREEELKQITLFKRRKKRGYIMEKHIETNGCEDGFTPVVVSNNSNSSQGGKPSERQVIKPATPSALQESRSTRHRPSGNHLRKQSSIVASHSTKGVSLEKRTTRRSPTHISSTIERRPVKNSVSTSQKENVINKRVSLIHSVSQSTQSTSSPLIMVVDTNAKSNKHPSHSTSIKKRHLKRAVLSEPENSVTRMSKRIRLQYQPFQSPPPPTIIPPILKNSSKITDDKIVVFNRGEFLAVRNENGTFFVCRTAQNVYKSSRRFKIQWLNNDDKDIYTPDFYDYTDFECVLTNLRMRRTDKNKYLLPSDEWKRTMNILQRALNVENGMDIPECV